MTTHQRNLNSNLEVRWADELRIEELRREKRQNDKTEREANEHREKSRIAAIDSQHRIDAQHRREDPVRPYDSYLETARLFEPQRFYGQTSEQRLEQILWSRVGELERDIEFLRER